MKKVQSPRGVAVVPARWAAELSSVGHGGGSEPGGNIGGVERPAGSLQLTPPRLMGTGNWAGLGATVAKPPLYKRIPWGLRWFK